MEALNEQKESEIRLMQEEVFLHTNMKRKSNYFGSLLRPMRIRESKGIYEKTAIEEYYSDRSRIIYSQPFRRLQQKAQVFSLETNSSVRSRLSHSIEVSDVGRLMAAKIVASLQVLPEYSKYRVNKDQSEQIVAIVENACLLHDIGNPPFGHFGETAIKKWWQSNGTRYLKEYNDRVKNTGEDSLGFTTKCQKDLLADFECFDGNPQGLRTVLRLRKNEVWDNQEEFESGMNLTYQTVLSCIKYVLCAGERTKADINGELVKKSGYFQSEKNIISKMKDRLKVKKYTRFPLVYIMEAADDISYCMSDVADGIEKDITTLAEFALDLKRIWEELFPEDNEEQFYGLFDENNGKKVFDGILSGEIKDFNIDIATKWAAMMIEEAAKIFVDDIELYCAGKKGSIVSEGTCQSDSSFKILKAIGEYSRRNIYTSKEAEEIEIAGYTIIAGLLDTFGRLLVLTQGEFGFLLDTRNNPKKKSLEMEARLCHLIGNKYIDSYKNQLREWEKCTLPNKVTMQHIEWWLRVHLIVDHIAGMTDEYALKSYQLCKGIDVKIF